jgi:hypothetical protein
MRKWSLAGIDETGGNGEKGIQNRGGFFGAVWL